MSRTAAPVEFKNITKKFGETVAVNNVSFKIEAGTMCTLLGPSGCGKTTILRMIAGLEMPTSGTILLGDKDITHLSTIDRDVTMVFQSYALFPHMNVIDNVSYGLISQNTPKEEALTIAKKWLDVVGLNGFEKRLPSELSGGQQQRVAVARALVLEPQVLLFDEPLSNLDAKLRRKMREDIRELQQSLGITSVYVTHDQEEALAISDKIIIMNKAVIAQEGSPRELYESPQSIFVANFMGDANLIEGIAEQDHVKVGDICLKRSTKPGPIKLAIRPESIVLFINQNDNCHQGKIIKGSYLGTHYEYTVATSIGELFVVDTRVDTPFQKGQEIYWGLKEIGISIL